MTDPMPAPPEHIHGAACERGCCETFREIDRQADGVIAAGLEHRDRLTRSGKMKRPSGVVKKPPAKPEEGR